MKQVVVRGATDIPRAVQWLTHWLAKGLQAGKPIIIKLSYESRSEAQNRHLWPMLTCFAKQREYGGKLRSKEEWKIILISAYKFDPQGIVIGINGEVVNLNYSSSELNKAQFSEFIELIYAQGCEYEIVWSDPAMKVYEAWSK